MGNMAESMAMYAQPLIDETDGSEEQLKKAYSIAQVCWNLALLPHDTQQESIAEMQSVLGMDDGEFEEFCSTVIGPMIVRHHELFPGLADSTVKGSKLVAGRKKHDGTGRNEPCPCGSGKKYKKCCGI